MDELEFTESEWNTCLKVLEILKNDPLNNPDNKRFSGIITKLHKNAKKALNKEKNENRARQDKETVFSSAIAMNALAGVSFFSDGKPKEQRYKAVHNPRNCYCCNSPYYDVHSFYHRLCPDCAEQNYAWRFRSPDLSGRNIIITGGRVKVGFATALRFLRAGANVTVTTRFPALALETYSKEPDYSEWKDKLFLYGLDLRNLGAVKEFITEYKKRYPHLDILINNAAQTIKYTEEFYRPIIAEERKHLENLSSANRLFSENKTPVTENETRRLPASSFDKVSLTRFGQPVDTRHKNSWNSTLEEIGDYELLEVNLINQISPYLMLRELASHMRNSPYPERFVINVTSSEGQFSYSNKTIYHPHTNMTKAALNMMTRTSARELAVSGIFMNAVDVGWISTGAVESLRKRQFERGYIPPLDSVDGASRIMHPVFESLINKVTFVGKLLKNYKIENW
ncbi:oxidoreductase (plasmid) [Fulvitalea axinellae]|uniref:Oxidoreductase n=1 Tax=Fulvitalea axinellae TaxID=1182444 RepID=A0AAU9DKL3_9BACT|nr:oxidoreductase [Fulvitalea axinellae]